MKGIEDFLGKKENQYPEDSSIGYWFSFRIKNQTCSS